MVVLGFGCVSNHRRRWRGLLDNVCAVLRARGLFIVGARNSGARGRAAAVATHRAGGH